MRKLIKGAARKLACLSMGALLSTAALAPSALAQGSSADNNYLIGTGIYDITGEVAESALFGYASVIERSNGLRDRQYARAFIMQEPGGAPIVFVSIDKGGMFQATNQKVMDALQARFGGLYNDDNVVISATHTHVSSDAGSHYGLYTLSTGGYFDDTVQVIVDGIVEAIARAHDNLAAGRIYTKTGRLNTASVNRSLPAYNNNADADAFPNYDRDMTVLKFIQGEDQEVGVISWFAVHPVSLPKTWTLTSADNKGFASNKFEREMGSNYDENSFVAAFAQSNAGDMSPNLNQPAPDDTQSEATGPANNPEASMEIIGGRQHRVARRLYDQANIQLTGSIEAVSRYNDYSTTEVAPEFTDDENSYTTCTAVLGISFAAGAEDGRSGLFEEGITKDPESGTNLGQCHAEKPPFFITGLNTDQPDTPKILPSTILKVGQLGILAAPAEFTIMSGRRTRQTVESIPGTGLDFTVLAGYADAYAGYVTTREEYATQQYEGASTHFGPWTLGAYRQEFARLAQKLADPDSNPWPNAEPSPTIKAQPINSSVNVIYDRTPWNRDFGDVIREANASYRKGGVVTATFWGGHPNNDFQTNDSYLEVQRRVGDDWETVALDRDQNTKFIWKRSGVDKSVIKVQWRTPKNVPAGEYRILHDGHYKTLLGQIKPYSGMTRTFTIN